MKKPSVVCRASGTQFDPDVVDRFLPSRVPRCPPYLPPPGRASPLPCSRGTYPESCKKLMDASCVPSIYANERPVVTNWMSAVPL